MRRAGGCAIGEESTPFAGKTKNNHPITNSVLLKKQKI
jgi:hypothetical protein